MAFLMRSSRYFIGLGLVAGVAAGGPILPSLVGNARACGPAPAAAAATSHYSRYPERVGTAAPTPPTRTYGAPAAGRGQNQPSTLEAQVLAETNLLRRSPQAYAHKLVRLRRYFRGNTLYLPGRDPLLTREGAAAVDEAISALLAAKSLPQLSESDGLTQAAMEHVEDLGRRGLLGHQGSDGSMPEDRADRYGTWEKLMAENITFGARTAEDVVIDLLIDDGVVDRGHRKVMLSNELFVMGVACGPHPSYGQSCVLDFATRFIGGGDGSSAQNQAQNQAQITPPPRYDPPVYNAVNQRRATAGPW